MSDKIPTAEGFFFDRGAYMSDVPEAMKEFAKLHVKAALEAANKQVQLSIKGKQLIYVNKQSILSAYPEHLIQ